MRDGVARDGRQLYPAFPYTSHSGMMGEGARIFAGACESCHYDGSFLPMFGTNLPLALNSNLHSARPDNLIRTVLDGIETPTPGLGPMPGFRDSLDDRQVATLVRYLRQRFAPRRPAWEGLEAEIVRLRAH